MTEPPNPRTDDPGPWRPVQHTRDLYECSPAGTVRRVDGEHRRNQGVLKPYWSLHGYLRVAFYVAHDKSGSPRMSFMLHDVIGAAWGPPLTDGEAYGLIDDSDRANVSVDNVGVRRVKVKP